MLKRRPWLRCLFQHLIEEGGVNSHSKNNPSSQLFVCLNFSSQYSSRSAFFIHSHKTFPFSPLTAPCFFKTLPSSLSDTFSLPLPFSLLSSLPSVSAFYFPATFFSSHHHITCSIFYDMLYYTSLLLFDLFLLFGIIISWPSEVRD